MTGSGRETGPLWDVGTDIGGTFTDIVAVHAGTGETRIAKVPSRPDAPVDAMLEAIAAIGLRPAQVSRFVHGTTRVTNAIVQERLPPIALIATAGFEDVLEIGRYRRRDLYRLDIPPKAPPLVPHERLVGERLRGVVPYVSLSHEVNPEAREYERASSTAYNAAAMPIAAEYLTELERRLPLGAGLQVFHSAGGMVPVATARQRPIVMALSGPAAGVAASVQMTNTSNTPAEMLEATYALRVERQSIRRGAGGAGLHRGGDGVIRAYRVLAPRMLLTTCVERIRVPPYGLCGGRPGLPFRITLQRDGVLSELPGKANLELRAGDLVTLESCGGGYGREAVA